MKIKIQIPVAHSSEIKYTLEVLLVDFLGLDVVFLDAPSEKIKLNIEGNIAIFQSDFFEMQTIIDCKSLPSMVVEKKVELGDTVFDTLTLYRGSITMSDFSINVDILGSTFFMLSRWEEYVVKQRDGHNRFSAEDSIAYKFGFLERPIVNEYVELLWGLLLKLGNTQQRKKRDYQLVPTHDVDRPYLFMDIKTSIRRLAGYVKRRNFREVLGFIQCYLTGRDPWDTHDLMMDLSEASGVKSHFFFLVNGGNRHDERHSVVHPKLKRLYHKVKERGHYVGFHPSYDSYNDDEIFQKQRKSLEEAIGIKLVTGRQHYLRFSLPETWLIWDNAKMEWDSTLSYADCAGFRCGVCYPFPVYDIINRKRLKLYERPLIVMEGSLVGYENLDLQSAIRKVQRLKAETKKYQGEFIFLYHNSSFFDSNYRDYGVKLLQEMYK